MLDPTVSWQKNWVTEEARIPAQAYNDYTLTHILRQHLF